MMRLCLLTILLPMVSGQMMPQCSCAKFNGCFASLPESVAQCADKCQSHFTTLGANYPAARQCIVSKMPQLRGTLNCARSNFGAVCGSGNVPRRYTETVQLAAFREISGQLSRAGLIGEATPLVQIAKKAVGCIVKCVQAQGCIFGKECGLALPPDNQIVSTFKSCATQSGFLTTPALRELCGCLGNAGVKNLAPLCPRLVIS